MQCNASYARFIFGKIFTSTIILYALLFAQKNYSCKKWVLQDVALIEVGSIVTGVSTLHA
jgi:hypothetical protein